MSDRHFFMELFAFGVNHTTASVDIREKLSFPESQIPQALQSLKHETHVQEAVILSTCNRTELYCSVRNDNKQVIDWFGEYHSMSRDKLTPLLYFHPSTAAVRHLLRVACGLDSLVLGEPQILGQIKKAYKIAQESGTSGKLLGKLFQHSFNVAKQVRTDTAIGASPVSVAFAAVRLAQQIFGDLKPHTALLIGAGETIELAARHLHASQLGRMIIANRTLERARHLALQFGGYAITLPELSEHLAEADVVISSTGSPDYILTAPQIKNALKIRKRRPMFIVDIAVPRDIDPAISNFDDVYLYTVDDLQSVIEENRRSRAEAAKQAEEIIDTQVDHFVSWMQSLGSVETIRAIKTNAEIIQHQVLEKSRQMLKNGKSPEETLLFLANRLTNTLLHEPLVQLRQAGSNNDIEFIAIARQLFKISA
jgi:glutamyl-tRNA reductase